VFTNAEDKYNRFNLRTYKKYDSDQEEYKNKWENAKWDKNGMRTSEEEEITSVFQSWSFWVIVGIGIIY
jgi:hypothetical protein